MIEMLYQMGYTGDISLLSKYKKFFLLECRMGYIPYCSRAYHRVQEDDTLQNVEEDTATTSERALTDNIPKVSSPPTSPIPTSNIFGNILKDPFQNLTTTPPSPPIIPPTLPMPSSPTTPTIPISFIAHQSPPSSIGQSLPQFSIPFSSPISIDSTTPSTPSISNPLENPLIKYVFEVIQNPGNPINISNTGHAIPKFIKDY
ncbi:unnamed protein product [Lactuca saligna]|uniref:Uncharacterized protein n=1 Tax=Lactuca saligna TaxID=75948 RepID=A0AA36A1L4_LACSI|nr:unnamed protein product [Lactuca saligna]